MTHVANISAAVTGFDRESKLLDTLRVIQECDPQPAEILVHIDGGREALAQSVKKWFPDVRVFVSEQQVGPGGGRNVLIHSSKTQWIASFDDDSRPVEKSFFADAKAEAERHADAAVIAATIRGPKSLPERSDLREAQTVDFVGCGCLFNREAFRRTSGFVPLPIAYGMEEVDLALRLTAAGAPIRKSSKLLVYHDTDESHHSDALINAGTLANVALHAWLRYPMAYLPLGIAQYVRRIIWLYRNQRTAGLWRGVCMTPIHLIHQGHRREAITMDEMAAYRRLKSIT